MLYHKAKWHYFMLDFCYYCQIVLLFCLYVIPHNQIYFRVTFALMYDDFSPLKSARGSKFTLKYDPIIRKFHIETPFPRAIKSLASRTVRDLAKIFPLQVQSGPTNSQLFDSLGFEFHIETKISRAKFFLHLPHLPLV